MRPCQKVSGSGPSQGCFNKKTSRAELGFSCALAEKSREKLAIRPATSWPAWLLGLNLALCSKGTTRLPKTCKAWTLDVNHDQSTPLKLRHFSSDVKYEFLLFNITLFPLSPSLLLHLWSRSCAGQWFRAQSIILECNLEQCTSTHA